MIDVQSNLNLLGKTASDKVTHLEGVITSVSFDLFGCVQGLLNPGKDADGKLGECYWFDVSRLVVSEKSVMPAPEFDLDKGPESKPIP